MKALPDKTEHVEHDVDTTDGAVGDRDTVVAVYDNRVVEVYSSQSDAEDDIAACDKKHRLEKVEGEEAEEEEDDDEEGGGEGGGGEEDYGEVYGRRKSKKKKKHQHKHHDDSRIRKKHKKRKKRVNPIFLWAQKKETKIVRVVCENYDRQNRIRLVRTSSGLWTSNPRSKVLAATQSRSSVYEYDDESQKDTDIELACVPTARPTESCKIVEEKPIKNIEYQQQSLVDLNDNSIDFGDTICNEEDEEEQRARIDQALEMIDRDPALLDDVKITLPVIEPTALKLPEGTTIHQVKAENTLNTSFAGSPLPSLTPPFPQLLSTPPVQCTFGELTIIPQQQQNEPLNLENVGKRSALEIRLQEPPFKRKRILQPPPSLPPPPPSRPLVGEPVKHEWDPLSELKEVLSDPRLCVPDPLLVPRARLAALVASPATEIPKLLQTPSVLPPPPPDHDLLSVSLSHLRSMLQQPGFMDEQTDGNNHQHQSSNMDQMLWLSYLSSKEMSGIDADLLSNMLNILLPNSSAVQQPFNYSQQNNQWNNIAYYNGNLTTSAYGSAAGYSKSDDCCASLSPLASSQQTFLNNVSPKLQETSPPLSHRPLRQSSLQLTPSRSHRKSPMLPPVPPVAHSRQKPLSTAPVVAVASKQQQHVSNKPPRVCQELCCNDPAPPPLCCEGCCSKPNGYNPYALSPPVGCNPFVISPTGCVGNLKNCTPYSTEGGSVSCCLSADIDCGYAAGQTPRKPPSVSPGNRVQYNYNQTGFGQQQKSVAECGDGTVVSGDNQTVGNKPTPPPPSSTTTASNSSGGNATAEPPLKRPKIKVKQHLVDPNAKPKLLNFEGALHLAGANPHDLFSSPLWHPLFGSQEKRFGCRWQWTIPVENASTSSNMSSKR